MIQWHVGEGRSEGTYRVMKVIGCVVEHEAFY